MRVEARPRTARSGGEQCQPREGFPGGHEGVEVAADLEFSIQECSLGGDCAVVDSFGGGQIGDESDVGGSGFSAHDLDRAAGDDCVPDDGRIGRDGLLKRHGDGGGGNGAGRPFDHCIKPFIGQEVGHRGRLRPRALASVGAMLLYAPIFLGVCAFAGFVVALLRDEP